MFQGRLLHQILLWILIPFLAIAAFTSYQLYGLVDHLDEHFHDDIQTIFTLIEADFKQILDMNGQLAEIYVGDASIHQAITSKNVDNLFGPAEELIESGLVDRFIIADAEGTVLVRGHDEFRFNDSIMSDELFSKALQGREFSGMAWSEGELALVTVKRIVEFDTLVHGVLILAKVLQPDVLASIERQVEAEIFLQHGNSGTGQFPSKRNGFLQIESELRINTINAQPISAVVTRDMRHERAKISSIARRILIFSAIALLLALLFVYVSIHFLLRPLRELHSWLHLYNSGEMPMSSLAKGKKKLSKSKNELSSIAYSAISTLQDLEASRKQISRYAEEAIHAREEVIEANSELHEMQQTLEKRVEQRTQLLMEKTDLLVKEAEERKLAEREIEGLKNILESILQSMPSCLIGVDRAERVILWNSQAEKVTGESHDAVIGRSFAEALELFGMQHSSLRKAVKIGEHLYRQKALRQGESCFYDIIAYPYRTEEETGTVIRIDDVTKLVWMEEELLKAEKLKSIGVLAGGIAHDFNNLLTAILGNISLSLVDETLNTETSNLLVRAEKASHRAKDLTQQLLTFAKGGSPVKEEMDLSAILKEYSNFATIGDRVSCNLVIPEDIWSVVADKGQIAQVFQNIIINATQAIAQEGHIEISCENVVISPDDPLEELTPGNYIKVTIADDGPGIGEELVNIFDPYFTTKEGGNGLGLAICHSIIAKHHGKIVVKSSFGQGTSFTIYLPAAASRSDFDPDEEHIATGNYQARILVMDDDPMVRELAGAMLRQLGCIPSFAKDGKQAIKMYKEEMAMRHPYDAVLMDLTIPGGMGGKEAMVELLRLDPQVKSIVSSGYSDDPLMANYHDFGFIGMLAKPYRLRDLELVLAPLLSRSSM